MTDIIPFTSKSLKTMVDGSLRLSIDIEPADAQDAFKMFGMPGVAGAICRLTEEASKERLQQETIKQAAAYGEQAKILKLSGFFRSPEVWERVGTDQQFLAWLRLQSCAARRLGGCDGDVVGAHVRRIQSGAGTGIKPPFSAIPLCNSHHFTQHNKGESALGGKEWFDKQRIEYLQDWCWEALKQKLGYEHWSEVPPSVLIYWATDNDVARYLPGGYR